MDKALKDMFSKYAVFKGRTSRADFWWAILGYLILSFIFGFVVGLMSGLLGEDASFVSMILPIWYIATFLPLLAIEVRRLHDINKSGWFMLLSIVPFGCIILIVFFCMPSVHAGNKY